MKKRIYILTTLLLISSLAVAASGAYIKYKILKPIGIDREESIIAMPFVYLTDDGLRFMVQMRSKMTQEKEPSDTLQVEIVDDAEAESTAVMTQAATENAVTEAPTQTVTATEPATEPVYETVTATEPATEPVYEPVDDSWFDDALFIGDSRAHALRAYCRMGEATYFTSVGMNIYNVFGTWTSDQSYTKRPLDSLLQTRTFGKVLINIGLNECYYDHAYIQEGFENLIALIQQYQPDTKIILMSVMMVTEQFAKRDACYDIENLTAINAILESLADGERVFYMDSNSWVVNEKGYLPDDVTGDGAHLYAQNYEDWAAWIREQCGKYAFD